MTSTRHNTLEDPYLDAARESILAVGWRRTPLTDVARRAGVSRMTIYRRWPDMQALLGDLLVREWGNLIDDALLDADGLPSLERIARGVTGTVAALRANPVFQRILDVDPELLLPYLLDRRGRNQDHVLDLLATAIRNGQSDGSVRSGDPDLLARALLLALHGFVISRATMADVPADELDVELKTLIERYLQP
jgi:AcrR family transcriptional regulator